MVRATHSILLTLLGAAVSCQAQSASSWQSSWPKFVAAIAPHVAKSEMPDSAVVLQFGGKTVTWEGTLAHGTEFRAESLYFQMQMAPQELTLRSAMAVGGGGKFTLTRIQLKPKPGTLEAWKQAPRSRPLRFRAVIPSSFPYIVIGVGGRVQLELFAEQGELISP